MSSMNGASEERVQELLERWDDLRRLGCEPPAEELCRDFPELYAELQRRIAALRATRWLEVPE